MSCSKLAHQLNYCNESVTLETSGLFLQPTLLSPKEIKWFILFKTTNIKSCPSTWRQLANSNTIPLSVLHFIRQSKEKRKRSCVQCLLILTQSVLQRFSRDSTIFFYLIWGQKLDGYQLFLYGFREIWRHQMKKYNVHEKENRSRYWYETNH